MTIVFSAFFRRKRYELTKRCIDGYFFEIMVILTFDFFKVLFEVPAEYENEWFNILVLHQNRARHGCKNYAGEHFLPSFMHLVFWGHEHECRIEPEDSLDEFRITQPGSSIATSLSPGEAVPKHVGMLKVHGKEFCIEKLPLRTVRPFVFDTLSLNEFSDIGYQFANDEVVKKIKDKLEEMLQVTKSLISGKVSLALKQNSFMRCI